DTTGLAVDFNRHIRPILSENCFQCHGPDDKQRKAKLRLDLPGQVVPQDLIERVTADDEHKRMPPAKTRKRLTPQQVELLKHWINQGAKWSTHWAFVARRRPPVPAVANLNWTRNPIDGFIVARLEAAGMSPSPEADKTTLIRRLTLDLTGLPPT